MEWNVVKISQTSGNNVPFVSIGRGQLDFNAVACDLINDCGDYTIAHRKGKWKNCSSSQIFKRS